MDIHYSDSTLISERMYNLFKACIKYSPKPNLKLALKIYFSEHYLHCNKPEIFPILFNSIANFLARLINYHNQTVTRI